MPYYSNELVGTGEFLLNGIHSLHIPGRKRQRNASTEATYLGIFFIELRIVYYLALHNCIILVLSCILKLWSLLQVW